ncbi:hypothetical protein GLOIN_2v1770668 [Rhizophagus irregularis DAOM 181602=DAOM 197198]|nr:hypothetical protein GLOIN_2v1770668 [Rhizophagus irregularis DAOM 181602=DAOM 197198]
MINSFCDVSLDDFKSWHLNRKCEFLHSQIVKAAIKILPNSHISNQFTPKVLKDLDLLTQDYRFVTKVTATIRSLTRQPDNFSFVHESKWSHYLPRFAAILARYKSIFVDAPPLPNLLAFCTSDSFASLFSSLSHISKTLRGLHILKEHEFQEISITAHIDRRNENFESDISSFIDSSFSRTRRRIVLDRVFIDHPTRPRLVTDLKDIMSEAVNHFQNYVPINLPFTSEPSSLPERWANAYAPLDSVDASIYDSLLDHRPIHALNPNIYYTSRAS